MKLIKSEVLIPVKFVELLRLVKIWTLILIVNQIKNFHHLLKENRKVKFGITPIHFT
jgi:hypothetical protein